MVVKYFFSMHKITGFHDRTNVEVVNRVKALLALIALAPVMG